MATPRQRRGRGAGWIATCIEAPAPSVVGKTIVEIAKARRPRRRYRVGFGAVPMLFLRWLVPDRAFDAIIGRGVGV